MTHTYKFDMRNLYINRLIKTWTNMTDRLPLLSRAKDKQDAETSKLSSLYLLHNLFCNMIEIPL